MADRITAKDCERVAEWVSGHMETLGLLKVSDGERLVIESGSATYGRAWKVYVTGGEYASGYYAPPFGDLRSESASVLRDKLLAVLAAFDAVTSCGHRVECGVNA